MPLPGKTIRPPGMTDSTSSLRRNGAALTCFVQFGLKDIWVTLRASAQQAATARRPSASHHEARPCRDAWHGLIELRPDEIVIVVVHPTCEGDLGVCGISTSVSARRRAERKLQLSIIAAVMLVWLIFEPVRGRFVEIAQFRGEHEWSSGSRCCNRSSRMCVNNACADRVIQDKARTTPAFAGRWAPVSLVSVRIKDLAKTTVVPVLPLRTAAPSSSAWRNVIQVGAKPRAIDQSGRALMPE